jgi:signal transduction histidine kinase
MATTQTAAPGLPDASRPPAGHLAALLEALPVPAVLFGGNGQAQAVNQLGRQAFVIDERAPLAAQPVDVVLLPFGAPAVEAVQAVAQGRAPALCTVLCGRTRRPAELRAVPVGRDGVLVSITDIGDRDAQQARLDRAERALRGLQALVPGAVRLVDLAGHLNGQNAAALLEHAEAPPATVRSLWELDAPHDPIHNRAVPFLEAPAMRALAGQVVKAQPLEVRRRGGRRLVEAYAAPLLDDMGQAQGAVLIDLDVTERTPPASPTPTKSAAAEGRPGAADAGDIERLVEERSRALMATHEEQVRERRLSAVGQLAAGVMHDVNNALNPIMAAAYLLRHHAESPEAVRDYADRIRKAAEMGAATASRVGRFIRQEPVHPGGDEEIDLSVIAGEVLDLTEPIRLRRSSESGAVHLARHFTDDVRMRGIPGEIREALLNLMQNAIDAMPDGGTLTICTARRDGDACVAVRDTGVGMSAEVRERAFEPFFTTKGAKGSGLGLAEVYGIARRHRGTATISSVPGRGTEIMLCFPAVALPPATPTVTAPVPLTPRRILVVEDHDDGREFLGRILTADGHLVEAVGTCGQARERLAGTYEAPYDLLLTDVGLPDGNGWDLVREAKAAHPLLRIGVISGWEPMVGTERAREAEFVLRKPLRMAELKAHVAGEYAPASPTD